MASKSLARGMGTFFKDCEHPQPPWPKCPHEYKIPFTRIPPRIQIGAAAAQFTIGQLDHSGCLTAREHAGGRKPTGSS